jgi:hypothetical protein
MHRNKKTFLILLSILILTSCNQIKVYEYGTGLSVSDANKLEQANSLFDKNAKESFNLYEEALKFKTIDDFNYIDFWNAGLVSFNLFNETLEASYKDRALFYLKATINFLDTTNPIYDLTESERTSALTELYEFLSELINYKDSYLTQQENTDNSLSANNTSEPTNHQSHIENLIALADTAWEKENYNHACKIYKEAFQISQKNHKYAAYSLTYCYLNIDGEGVKSDLNLAAYYFNKSKSDYLNDEGYKYFSENISALQSQYQILGYYNSTIDGIWGSGTAKAYSQLRKKYKNLNVSGDAFEIAYADIERELTTKDINTNEHKNEVHIELPNSQETIKNLTATELYKLRSKSIYFLVGLSNKDISQGSAVAVSPRRLFTNCHVVEGKVIIGILSPSDSQKTTYIAEVVKRDKKNDACILDIKENKLNPVLSMKKYSSLQVGQKVYAIGNPQGLDLTLSDGLLSSKRSSKNEKLIQFTAPISSGSSGGGLFDEHGALIGITTSSRKDSQNINFAIPIDYFK